jgi:hypothetical protein
VIGDRQTETTGRRLHKNNAAQMPAAKSRGASGKRREKIRQEKTRTGFVFRINYDSVSAPLLPSSELNHFLIRHCLDGPQKTVLI